MKLVPMGQALCLLALAIAPMATAATLPNAGSLAGLNPGDTYQFVFVTSGVIGGSSSSLSTYNTFVQNAADSASIGTGIGVNWTAMVSTGGGSNRAIVNAPVAAATKVYLLDGTMVANGGSNPFYSPGENTDHLAAIALTELLTTTSGLVWSGGNSSGSESGSGLLGGSTPVYGNASGILACRCTGGWARDSNTSSTNALHLYAVSQQFTAPSASVPEPSTWGMAAAGFAALLLARRRASR